MGNTAADSREATVELGTVDTIGRMEAGLRQMGRQQPRFNWRVRAILGVMAACQTFIAVVFLLGAGAWNRAPALLMVARVAPLRTWGIGALFIAGSAAWALWRDDSLVYRLTLVGCAGFFATWTAAFVASWVIGESLSPVGIGLCGMISAWSIVLAGVPLTDPVREAAYELVRSVGAPPSLNASAATAPPRART
jgi:hypothetical protein